MGESLPYKWESLNSKRADFYWLSCFFERARIVEEFKVYSVSDAYISYLREHEPNVYSNKEDNRTHTRKYIGIVHMSLLM